MYAPDAKNIVYCPTCFWSDNWNPMASGKQFDFSRPFFEQFSELLQEAPLLGLINMNTENSEYCNRIYNGRNNYLSFIVLFESENMLHSYYTMTCKDCCDSSYIQKTEFCYEVTDGEHCHSCFFCTRVRNCSNSWFLEDCISCTDCFQCKNLHQRSYCIQNKQYTKEEYGAYMQKIRMNGNESLAACRAEAERFFLTQPYRAIISINCENCTGTNIFNSKDCSEIYDFYESERMRFCTQGEKSHDCMDCCGFGIAEFCYECENFIYGNHDLFCIDSPESSDCFYSFNLYQHCANNFGCVGLKKKEFCILNTQYTQQEYEELVPKIIEHMRQTGEYGAFFPGSISPFGYNETVGKEHFPITKEQASTLSYRWRDPDQREYLPASTDMPDSIKSVSDDIVREIFKCEDCGKNYKVIAQELAFYRKAGLPLPMRCPDCRHAHRMQKRPARTLWKRACDHCKKDIMAAYAPDRPEIIYCEDCYLKQIY